MSRTRSSGSLLTRSPASRRVRSISPTSPTTSSVRATRTHTHTHTRAAWHLLLAADPLRRTFLGSDGNAEVFRFSNLHHLLGKQEYDQPPFLQSSTKLNAFQITQLVPSLLCRREWQQRVLNSTFFSCASCRASKTRPSRSPGGSIGRSPASPRPRSSPSSPSPASARTPANVRR